MFGPSPLARLMDDVDTVAAAGATVPDEYTRVVDRWKLHHQLDTQAISDTYIDMVLGDAEPAELSRQRSLVFASDTNPATAADLTNTLGTRIYQAARAAYDTVADANYRHLQAEFNTTAAALTKALAAIDPDTPAEQAVTLGDRQRKAWTDAALHAVDLDNRLPALWAAAKLAHLSLAAMPEADQRFALVITPGEHHRRRVWEAIDTTDGRTGRWGALTALGVPIAAVDLSAYKPYRRPKPLEERWETVSRGTSRRIIVDPEDAPTSRV